MEPVGEFDRFAADRFHQVLEEAGSPHVCEFIALLAGTHDLAAVIRRHLEAAETDARLLTQPVEADVLGEHIDDVPHIDPAVVAEIVRLERVVHVLGEIGVVPHGLVGRRQVLETSAAGSHQIVAGLLGHREIAGSEHGRQQLVDV